MNAKKTYIPIALFTLFLVAIFVFAMLPSAVFAKAEEEIIYISTVSDFAKITPTNQEGKTYALKNDIYFGEKSFAQVAVLSGTFDGQGHSLINAHTTIPIFFTITETGKVKNLNIVDSQLNASDIGFVTRFNQGIIDNVKVWGTIIGNNVGGLTGYNYGIIENSFVKVAFEANKAGAFTNINVKAHQDEGGEIVIDNNGIIRESYFDCYLNGDKLLSPVGDDGNGLYTGEYSEPTDILIADGYIDDLFDILYFKELETSIAVTQKYDINLYNIKNLEIESAVLSSDYQLNGKGFYNNKSDYQAITSYWDGAIEEPIIAALPEGSGSEQYPYMISAPSHLKYIADMQDTEGLHFYLANSISLCENGIYYNIHIPNFAGVFDGADRAITGILGGSLFGTNTGEIKNLFASGYSHIGSALLVQNNQEPLSGVGGNISNIEVLAEFPFTDENDYSAVVVHTNTGRISGVTANTRGSAEFAVAVAVVNEGEILRTRNLSTLPFVYYNDSDYINNVFNNNSIWSVTNEEWQPNSFVYRGEDAYIAPTDIYSFVQNNSTNWGFERGILSDIPVLKFASDNIAYKQLVPSAGQLVRTYRDAGYSLHTIEGILGLPTGGSNAYGLWQWEKEISGVYTDIEELEEPHIIMKNDEGGDDNFPYALNAGAFRIYYTVDATLDTAGWAGYAYFTIQKANKTYNKDDFAYIDGILTDAGEGSIPYSGNNIIPDQLIVPMGAIAGTAYSYRIVSYIPHVAYFGGELPLNDAERKSFFESGNTGTYTIEITATHPNYNIIFNVGLDFRYKITPLSLLVNPILATDSVAEVPYNTDIQNYIQQNASLDIQGLVERDNASPNLISIANYSFDTNYTKGVSGVGSGYYVKVKNRYLINYVLDLTGSNGRANFNVIKAEIPSINDVALVGKTVEYNGAYHTIQAANLKEHMQVTYLFGERYIDAGENQVVTISISYKDNADNYISVQKTASLTITPKPITITADNKTVTYKSSPPTYTAEVPVVNRADGGTDSIDILLGSNYQSGNSVGTYSITRLGGLGNPNYVITFLNGILTVVPAERNLSLSNPAPVYNRIAYSPQYSGDTEDLSSSGYTVGYLDAQGNAIAAAPKDSGQYKLIITYPATQNYLGGEAILDFSIQKAELGAIQLKLFEGNTPHGALQTQQINNFSYERRTYTVKIDASDYPNGEIFIVKYNYNFINNQSNQQFTDWETIIVADAGLYSNIFASIEGNPNYQIKTVTAANIQVAPKAIEMETLSSLTYNGKVRNLAPLYTKGMQVFEGDEVNITYTSNPTEIKLPDDYAITYYSDNPNYTMIQPAIPLRVNKAAVTINVLQDIGVTSFVFGEQIGKKFKVSVPLELGGDIIEEEITFIINTDIAGALTVNLYDIADAEDTDGIDFNLINVGRTVSITPKPLSIDWRIDKNTIYTGTAFSVARNIGEEEFASQKPTNNPIGAKITVDRTVKDAGEYTASASFTLPFGAANYYFPENTFTFDIIPAPLTVQVQAATVRYPEALPLFSSYIEGLLGDDLPQVVDVNYYCEYRAGIDTPGEYNVLANATANNYNITVVQGVLTVGKGILSDVAFADTIVTYKGMPITVADLDITVPSGAECEFINPPPQFVNEDGYIIRIKVTKEHYENLTISAIVTIVPAVPEIFISGEVVATFRDNIILSNVDIATNAIVLFPNMDGTWEFVETYTLKYGKNNYTIRFTPDDPNYTVAESVAYIIDAKINTGEVALDWGDYLPEDGEIILDDTPFIISLSAIAGLADSAELYVNGNLITSGVYLVTEAGSIDIEIRLSGTVYYQTSINVMEKSDEPTPDDPPDDPDPKEDPDDPDDPVVPDIPTEPPIGEDKSVWVYVGIGAGGAALIGAVIAAVVVLVKRKQGTGN